MTASFPINITGGALNILSGNTLAVNATLTLTSSSIAGPGTLAISSTGTLTSNNPTGTNTVSAPTTNAGTVITQSGVLGS